MKVSSSRRRLIVRAVVALAVFGLLLVALIWRGSVRQTRSNVPLTGNRERGLRLFETKGCLHCHSVNGWGAGLARDLGAQFLPEFGSGEFASGMWNCIPRTLTRIQAEGLPYPTVSQTEMADLFAYLYTTRYLDEPGDEHRGLRLFATKGCAQCHEVRGEGGKRGPSLSEIAGLGTPIRWAEAMWNHAPTMEAAMQDIGLPWPKFEDREMNDLLAFIRGANRGSRNESELLPANPQQGRELFQSKSCIVCHSVGGEGGSIGPEIASAQAPPLTLVQFAGVMWNHSPEMWRASEAQNIPRPTFEAEEMADLVAFLWSLRYFEPGGSAETGESLFAERSCDRCHGPLATGTPNGPALRGREKTYNLVAFATELWSHGPKMHQRAQLRGIPWPTLGESDVGNLLAFLNAPIE